MLFFRKLIIELHGLRTFLTVVTICNEQRGILQVFFHSVAALSTIMNHQWILLAAWALIRLEAFFRRMCTLLSMTSTFNVFTIIAHFTLAYITYKASWRIIISSMGWCLWLISTFGILARDWSIAKFIFRIEHHVRHKISANL
jgi:hypothetical protein